MTTEHTPTDVEIEAVIAAAVRSGAISWAGYKKDENGEYTLPVLSQQHFQIARVVLAHAAANHWGKQPCTPSP